MANPTEYMIDDAQIHADRYGGWTLTWTAPDGTPTAVTFVPSSVERLIQDLGLVRIDAVVGALRLHGLIDDPKAGTASGWRARRGDGDPR